MDLIFKLRTYKDASSKHLISLINYAHRCLNAENCLIVHAFLLNLQRQKPKISPLYIRSLNYCINFLRSKLKFINESLKVTEIVFQSATRTKGEVYDIYQEITSKVVQILIKSSFKEFENIINSHFGERKLRKYEFVDDFIYRIERMKFADDKVRGYHLLCGLIECDKIEEKDEDNVKRIKVNENLINYVYDDKIIKRVVDCFIRCKINSAAFFYILYLTNPRLYSAFDIYIFSEGLIRLDVLKYLPAVNLEGKELNEPVIRYLIENRPVYRQQIVEHLIQRRDLLLNILKDHYSFFSIVDLNLSFEEHLILCETINENVFFLFEYLKFFVEIDKTVVTKFVKMLVSKDESFLKIFLETFYTSKSEIYETVILIFLRQKRLAEELQNFFIEYFIEKIKIKTTASLKDDEFEGFSSAFARDVFFTLIYYLKKTTLTNYLETYLKDEATLREFLKVLTPNDIYYAIHYFTDIHNSLSISQIIVTKKEVFNEQVSIYAINKMEESALPPLFMRTVIVSLINFPGLKKFVVDLMFRLVRLEIWKFPRLYDGFQRCLTMLGSACCEVVMAMPEDKMKQVLACNEKVLAICENHIKSHTGLRGKYAFLFKNAVYGQLKKKGGVKK